MPSTPSRRAILALLVGTATAGCLDSLPGRSQDGIRLGSLGIYNRTDEDWTVTVRLERDGEVVHDDTHEVTPENEPIHVDPEWPAEPADYELIVHVDGEIQVHEFDAEDERSDEGDCTVAQIMLDSHGHGVTLRAHEETGSDRWRCG